MKKPAKVPAVPAPKAARAPKAGGAPGKSPMAPPFLASKMRGNAKMPKMMAKGGKVRGCS